MYGKVHRSIFTGSLYGQFEATVTLIAAIALSDREGYLNYTPAALAGATGFPLEVIKKGLEELQKPDVNSRSEKHEGRRIIPQVPGNDNGWQVVNKEHYSIIKDPDAERELARERQRRHRGKSRDVTPGHGESRHIDKDLDLNQEKERATGAQKGEEAKRIKLPRSGNEAEWKALSKRFNVDTKPGESWPDFEARVALAARKGSA